MRAIVLLALGFPSPPVRAAGPRNQGQRNVSSKSFAVADFTAVETTARLRTMSMSASGPASPVRAEGAGGGSRQRLKIVRELATRCEIKPQVESWRQLQLGLGRKPATASGPEDLS